MNNSLTLIASLIYRFTLIVDYLINCKLIGVEFQIQYPQYPQYTQYWDGKYQIKY